MYIIGEYGLLFSRLSFRFVDGLFAVEKIFSLMSHLFNFFVFPYTRKNIRKKYCQEKCKRNVKCQNVLPMFAYTSFRVSNLIFNIF